MADDVVNNFLTIFDTLVKHEGGVKTPKLILHARQRRGNGKTFTFNRMGHMVAGIAPADGSDIPLQNVEQDNVTVSVQDLYAVALSKERDLNKISYDERRELAMAAAAASANEQDQRFINALVAGKSATISAGATNRNWTLADFVDLVQEVKSKNISGNLYYAVHPKSLAAALRTTEVASADYNVTRALAMGDLPAYMGVTFIQIGDLVTADNPDGGLPQGGTGNNDRSNFLFSDEAMGWAMSQEVKTVVDWLPGKQGWMVGQHYSAAAVAIGSFTAGREGIYEHIVDEAVV